MNDEGLIRLQKEVDNVDIEIIKLLCFRLQLSRLIREYNLEQGIPLLDRLRKKDVIDHWGNMAQKFELDTTVIQTILRTIEKLCQGLY